jgi:hypothetical protein
MRGTPPLPGGASDAEVKKKRLIGGGSGAQFHNVQLLSFAAPWHKQEAGQQKGRASCV